jgi:hypothetical protein
VGQKSPIEVQHAWKSVEQTGVLGRVAVLEMRFIQRLGTLGGYLVTKEGYLGCSKDTLRRVDEDPVPLKLVE